MGCKGELRSLSLPGELSPFLLLLNITYKSRTCNMTWFSFCCLKSSNADGLGSFSSMLPTKAEEADIPGGDRTCCPRGDCCHSCPCDVLTGPAIQCGGPHQVISLAGRSIAFSLSISWQDKPSLYLEILVPYAT